MIVAPFFGEFGWEVALWVPWIRAQFQKLARSGQATSQVFCREGHEPLYRDFCKPIGVPKPKHVVSADCQHGLDENGKRIGEMVYIRSIEAFRKRSRGKTVTMPTAMPIHWPPNAPPHVKGKDVANHHYGIPRRDHATDFRTVLFHVRAIADKQPDRNWLFQGALDLAQHVQGLGYRVVTIGKPGEALPLPGIGVDNLIGADLEILMRRMATSLVIVGPSSGPMHLANFCGCRALWWSENHKDVPRYAHSWNPFRVKNVQAVKSWRPHFAELRSGFKEVTTP